MEKIEFYRVIGEYIDLKKLSVLNWQDVEKVQDFFNNEDIMRKVTGKRGRVTFRGSFNTLKMDASHYNSNSLEEGELLEVPKDARGKFSFTVFLYFVFKENGMLKDEDNLCLFEMLADTFEYNYDAYYFPNKQDFVIESTILWNKGMIKFNDYLNEMETKKIVGDLESISNDKEDMVVGDFIKRVEELCKGFDTENNIRVTRKSVQLGFDAQVQRVESTLCPTDDESFCEFCEKNDLWRATYLMIVNTEPRRRWYLYRIIQFIVEKQIDDIVSKTNSLEELIERVAYRRNRDRQNAYGDIQEEDLMMFSLPEGYEEIDDIEAFDAKEFIYNNCFVNFSNIIYIFELIFDDKLGGMDIIDKNGEEADNIFFSYIFDPWIYRCILRGLSNEEIEKIAEENDINVSDDKIEKIIKERRERFGRIVYDKKYNHNMFQRPNEGMAANIISYLKGDKEVSRELLLSFVLLAKVLSVGERIGLDYVRYHVLENSRFDVDDHSERLDYFDEFFLKSFEELEEGNENIIENIDRIRDNIHDMELKYLKVGVAPFREMIEGVNLR